MYFILCNLRNPQNTHIYINCISIFYFTSKQIIYNKKRQFKLYYRYITWCAWFTSGITLIVKTIENQIIPKYLRTRQPNAHERFRLPMTETDEP